LLYTIVGLDGLIGLFLKMLNMPDSSIDAALNYSLPSELSACQVDGYPEVTQVLMPGLKGIRTDSDDWPKVTGSFGVEQVPGIQMSGIKLSGMTQFQALEQYNPFWIRPRVGSSASELGQLDKQVQCLLWLDEQSQYHVLLPLIGEGFRACLLGDQDQGLAVQIELDAHVVSGPLLMTASGDDPFALMQRVTCAAAETLRSFRLRAQKPVPEFVDMFGWCTWDAFYHDVNQDKLYAGMESFAKAGLIPQLVVLDDGWLSLDDKRRLDRFEPDAEKFPEGLAPVIAKIKEQYGVKRFGVWHTLGGYWQGVNPDSELGKAYDVIESADPLRKHDGQPLPHAYGTSNKLTATFYHDFYRYLRSLGVDLTKVDNQNSQAYFTSDRSEHAKTVQTSQLAYQGAAWAHFMGNTIHCMCNRNDVAYNMSATTVWRNSDDYFPDRDGSHQCHIYYNVMNNLWTSQFAIPDWDMFWSGAQTGAYHAAARAISGGPVYVSDKPDEQNFDVLRKLCTSDGHALRCAEPALPTRDSLFVDYFTARRLLKTYNRNGNVGMLGVFHCLWDENVDQRQSITDRFSVADVPGLEGDRFAIYQHESKSLTISQPDDEHAITLGFREHEIITLAPLEDGVAMLGLLDKYNSSAAILGQSRLSAERYQWTLIDGGLVGLVSERGIKQASLNGKPVTLTPVAGSALWTLQAPVGQVVELQIDLKA
tara:strand:+ start:42119 stop:44233 length:2115 start_codon:yes stop_codon:yes gene_type:complete